MKKTNTYNKKNIVVSRKSIILDQIERKLAIERIKKLCQISEESIKNFSEMFLF